jgi:large subunit ribosomal protein L29
MKAKEIRDLTTQEIEARIVDEKDKLLRLRLNHAVSAIESPSDIRESRRTLARLSTILRERQTAEQDNQ